MTRSKTRLTLLAGLICLRLSAQAPPATAIVGGTLVDGHGGPAVADAVVVLSGSRIVSAGPRRSVAIPANATEVDARGRWIVPGFIDTNVHLSLYGGQNDRYESLVRYQPRQREIVLEAAQIDLSYGVTTVRDSYGALVPLTDVRDAINRGEKLGARILAAGNILGWSEPYSFSFSRVTTPLTLFQEQIMAIEGLVELGMTPSQALVAATKNGAAASRRLADFGTIEAGKLGDLVVLSADPLADIRNIRKVEMVFKDGRAVDRARLPEARVLSVARSAAKAGTGPVGK